MNTGASLLAAIIDDPGCDLRRLVYADWLEENGEVDRAEFIRVQVELAGPLDLKTNEGVYLRRRERELRDTFVEFGAFLKFRRGFADRWRGPLDDWMAHGPDLVRAHPLLTRVEVSDRDPVPIDAGPLIGWWFYLRRDLPGVLWGAIRHPRKGVVAVALEWPTREKAVDDLSAACLLWAKVQAARETAANLG